MSDLSSAQRCLEGLGVRHAPFEWFSDRGYGDKRCINLSDRPGIYYILGSDNGCESKTQFQLLFLGDYELLAVREKASTFAMLCKATVAGPQLLPGSSDDAKVYSVYLELK